MFLLSALLPDKSVTKTDEGKVDLAGWEHYDWPDWVNTQIKLLPQETQKYFSFQSKIFGETRHKS